MAQSIARGYGPVRAVTGFPFRSELMAIQPNLASSMMFFEFEPSTASPETTMVAAVARAGRHPTRS
jgi:hypothetical protein